MDTPNPATTTPPPEPLAAILADYRADIHAMTSGELPHPTPEYLRILLDRIAAAAERDKSDPDPSRTSAIFAAARKCLEDASWIDEITGPDEDGQPNDYARRVVPLDDALAALSCIEAPAAELRCLRDLVRRMLEKLAIMNAGYRLMLQSQPDADMADLCLRTEAILREARAALAAEEPRHA